MAKSRPRRLLSEVAFVTDYVANGSFATLRANVQYLDRPDHAILVRLVDFRNGWNGDYVYVSQDAYLFLRKSSLEPGDVIVSNVGANAGTVFRVPDLGKPMTLGPNAVVLKTHEYEDTHREYLYYYFLSPVGQHQLQSILTGSAQPKFNKTDLRTLRISFPSLPEQRAIAQVLDTLDDKIELNRQMNHTLEAIARAIFKSWFVDFDPVWAKIDGEQPYGMGADTAALFPNSFEHSELGIIPEGWRVGTLDDITQFVLGGDWGKDLPWEEWTEPVICIRGADIPSLQSGGMGKMPVRYLKRSSLEKRGLVPNDIVIEISGGSPTQSTGRSVLITSELLRRFDDPLAYSNFCRMFRPTEERLSIYVYLWLRWLYATRAFLQYETGTTGIKNFAYRIFSQQHRLLIPRRAVLESFNSMVSPLFRQHQENGIHSDTLAELRDTLLPKLISGELRVPDAEEPVVVVSAEHS